MSYTISSRRNPAAWEDPVDILAQQLAAGRLTLVLGAGVSFGYGLPQWDELTARAAKICNCTLHPKLSPEEAAEIILSKCGNEAEFGSVIRKALYQTYDRSMQNLTENRLLAAIGALTMASVRGNVTQVVSFNFDDLLERFLDYHGFVQESIGTAPTWSTRSDVRVYHPHGILPSEELQPVIYTPVLAQVHFDQIVGKSTDAFRNVMIQLFSSGTCLFLGLSGKDKNLTSILFEVSKIHPGIKDQDPFWGVRVSDDKNDPLREMWATRKVCQFTINGYSSLPSILFDICQRAAALTKKD